MHNKLINLKKRKLMLSLFSLILSFMGNLSQASQKDTMESVIKGRVPSTVLSPVKVNIKKLNGVSYTEGKIGAENERTIAETKTNPRPVEGFVRGNLLPPEYLAPLDAPDSAGRYRLKSVVPEAVIGRDDRERVNATSVWPWRVQGKLYMTFPGDKRYIGSGTLINQHHVLTAGHCVYDKDLGGWATDITFVPAMDDGRAPFGMAYATRLLSVKGWTENNNSDYDFGMLILDREKPEIGHFGIITGPDNILNNYRVNITGYPGDKGGLTMWTMADVIKSVSSERFIYDIDTAGGQSGSGVWSHWDPYEGFHVAGIHTTGSLSGNGATRISQWKFDRIVEWMRTW